MDSVVVDTDVVSLIFKEDRRARLFRRHLTGRARVISFMTIAEIRLWPLVRNWGRERKLAGFLRRYAVYYANDPLCDLWAQATFQARRNGRPIDPSDAWMAATALVLKASLVTNNPTDYAGVDGLTVLTATPP